VGGYPAARHAFQELFTARSLGINTLMVIAMGGAGSAQAMESADVVLMGDDLRQLSFIVRLSRSTWRTIRANIAFALAIKAAVWMAILADVGASLAVILNGMRLRHAGRVPRQTAGS